MADDKSKKDQAKELSSEQLQELKMYEEELGEQKYLNPSTDSTFKRICENKKVTMSILNSMLDLESPIVDITLHNTTRPAQTTALKDIVLDVYAEDSEGRHFVLEIQLNTIKHFGARALRYIANAYSNQIEKGKEYSEMKKAYLLAITDQVMFKEHNDYKSTHKLIEANTGKSLLDFIEMRFYEAPKFSKSPEELKELADVWLYFFAKFDYSKGKIPDLFKKHEVVMDALESINRANWSKGDLFAYFKDQDRVRDYKSHEDYVRDEGIQIGEKRGFKIGQAQGKQEGVYQIISALLSSGMSAIEISERLNIPLSEIEKISQ